VRATRGGTRWGATPDWVEARGQGLEQSPSPTGTRIRGASTGVAVAHRRLAPRGRGSVPPDTMLIDTRGVSMPPPFGHRPGRNPPNLAMRGAARSARHQGEESLLGYPRGKVTHRRHPEEG